MASSADVAAYRAAEHTVAATVEHFGIKERAVYKAVQVAHSRQARAGRPGCTLPVPSVEPSAPRSEAVPSPPAPLFNDLPDDIAGDNTYWRFPVTGELYPAVPGSHRHAWMAERKALHARLAAARSKPTPSLESAPDPVPVPVPEGIGESIESTPAPALLPEEAPAPLPTAHNETVIERIVVVKRYEAVGSTTGLLPLALGSRAWAAGEHRAGVRNSGTVNPTLWGIAIREIRGFKLEGNTPSCGPSKHGLAKG